MWDVDFTGIGKETITLKADAALTAEAVGQVGKISAEATGGLCAAEDAFYGVIDVVDLGGGTCAMQRKGFKEVAYSDAAPDLGLTELVADGNGGVKVPAAAGTGRIVDIVSLNATAGMLVMDLG